MDEDCHDALTAYERWYSGCYAESVADTGDVQSMHSATLSLISGRGRKIKGTAGDFQSLFPTEARNEEGKEDPASAEDALPAEALNPPHEAAKIDSPEVADKPGMDGSTTETEIVGDDQQMMTSLLPEVNGSENPCDVETLGQFETPLRFLQDKPFRLQRSTRRRRKSTRSTDAGHHPVNPNAVEGGGLLHLSNLLIVLEQLEQVLRLNKSLERRCDFLRATRSLVKYQNAVLLSETRPVRSRHLAIRSTKRSTSACLQNFSFDIGEAACLSPLGVDTSTRRGHFVETGYGAGSATGNGADHDVLDCGTKTAGEKALPPCERKKSKKLQAKWEQMKKVFSGKTEASPRKTEEDATSTARDAGKFKNRKSKRFSTIVALNDVAIETLRSASTQGKEDPGQERGPSSPSSVKSEPMGTEAEAEMQLAWVDDGLDSQGQKRQGLRHSCSIDSAAEISPRSPRKGEEEQGEERMDGGMNEDKRFVFPDDSGTHPTAEQAEPAGSGLDALDTSSLRGFVRSKSFKMPAAVESSSSGVHLGVTMSKSMPSSPITAPGQVLEGHDEQMNQSHGVEPGRRARAAWGKVKDIIHTRRESFKLKAHRQGDGQSKGEGHPKIDGQHQDEGRQKGQGLQKGQGNHKDQGHPLDNCPGKADENLEESRPCDVKDEPSTSVLTSPLMAQSEKTTLKEKLFRHPSASPKRSTGFLARRREKSHSPTSRTETRFPLQRQKTESSAPRSSRLGKSPQNDDISAKGTDETSTSRRTNARKKSRKEFKTIGRAKSVDASVVKFTEDFINKMEEWEEKQKNAAATGATSSRASRRSHVSESNSTDANTRSSAPGAPPEKIEQLSESFSRTVENWEKVRGGRAKSREGRSGARTRDKGEDSRSWSRERSKSAQRMEKELMKIEKKEQKLESELQKLTEMKQRLEGSARDGRSQEKVKGTEKVEGAEKVKDKDKVKDAEKVKGVEKFKGVEKAKSIEKVEDTEKVKDVEKVKDMEKVKGVEKVKDADKVTEAEKLAIAQKLIDAEKVKTTMEKVNDAEKAKVSEVKDTEKVNDSRLLRDTEKVTEKVKDAEEFNDAEKVIDAAKVKELDKVEVSKLDDKKREKSTDDTILEHLVESRSTTHGSIESSRHGSRPEMNSGPEVEGTHLPQTDLAEPSACGLDDKGVKGQETGTFVNCESKGVGLKSTPTDDERLRLEDAGEMGAVGMVEMLKQEIASKDEQMASLDKAMDKLREQVAQLQQGKEQRSDTVPAEVQTTPEVISTTPAFTQTCLPVSNGNETNIITNHDTRHSTNHSTNGTPEGGKTITIDTTINDITSPSINTITTANADVDTSTGTVNSGTSTIVPTIASRTTDAITANSNRTILVDTAANSTGSILDSTRISNECINVNTRTDVDIQPSHHLFTQSEPISQFLGFSTLAGHSAVAPKGRERRRSAEDDPSLRRSPSAFRRIFRSVRTRREPQLPRSRYQEASHTAPQEVRRFRPIVVRSSEGLDDQFPGLLQNTHLLDSKCPVGTTQTASSTTNSVLESTSSRAAVVPRRDLEMQRQVLTFTPPKIISLHHIGELCPRGLPNGMHSPDVKNTSETSFQPDWTAPTTAPKYRTLPHYHTFKIDKRNFVTLDKASRIFEGHSLKNRSPFQKSPSPIVLRKLKTAAELMADSERRRIRLRHSSERLGHRSRTSSDDEEASLQTEMRTSQSTGWTTKNQENSPVETHHNRLVRNVRPYPSVEDGIPSPLPPLSPHTVVQNPFGLDNKKPATSSFEFGRVPARTFALCSIPPNKKIVPSLGNDSGEKVQVGSTNPVAHVSQSKSKSSVSNHKETAFCVTATNTDRSARSVQGSNPGQTPCLQAISVGISDGKSTTKDVASLRISDVQSPAPRSHSGADKSAEKKESEGGQTQKTKPKFLDGGWLIRSKKFFKSSK